MKIFVVDTETTGLRGPSYGDQVVEIGIASVDTETRTVRREFSKVVGYNVALWDGPHRDAWIFRNTNLTLRLVSLGTPIDEVREMVERIVGGQWTTSYNMDFDFGTFLNWYPWALDVRHAPCIMKAADRLGPEIPRKVHDMSTGSMSFPSLENSYKFLCPDDPAGLGGAQDHRALSDAVVASHVLLTLLDRGLYDLPAEATS